MIKIKLIVPKLLSSDQNIKGHTQILHLEYNHPVSVDQILEDYKINKAFLGVMLLDDKKSVDKHFIIEQSCELKLFIIMGGG